MSTNPDAWQAGIDATILDNTISKNEFADAIQTVATLNSNPEVALWIDEIVASFDSIGVINNPTFNSLRAEIINEGAVVSRAQFGSLQTLVNNLPSTTPINEGLRMLELRSERDQVNGNIVTLNTLKVGQNRQVREAINLGIDDLRAYKQRLTEELQAMGDV